MYEIKNVNDKNLESIKNFLYAVPAIEEIDEKIIQNASVLYNDNNIEGIISYEVFFNYALIRYFVFKRNVDEIIIKELFETIEKNISKLDIEYIFSLVNQDSVHELFSSLDFHEIDKENIYIEESSYANSKFKDTKLLIKKIEKN